MQTEQETALGAYAPLMLEHVPAGMALFDVHELRLLAANTRYQALLEPQWQHGHALGHPLIEFLPRAIYTEIAALFRGVVETGASSRMEAYAASARLGEARYWDWSLEPIAEQGQVRYVLLTIAEVTPQVQAQKSAEQARTDLAQAQQELELEQQRHGHLETILLSVRSIAEPQAFAQALLCAIDTCFSPHLLALYSKRSEQETLSLLASHTPEYLPQETPVLPAFLAGTSGGSLLQAMQQRTPLIRRTSQEREVGQEGSSERDTLLALPEVACVVYLPLWRAQGARCEGVLVAGFATEEELDALVVPTLAESAPHLAEALVEAWLQAALADERQRLRTVLDQLPEGVILVEAQSGKVSYANRAAAGLLGYTLPHLVGAPLNQSAMMSPYQLPPAHQQSAFRWNFALIHALWGKIVMNEEIVVSRPDGSEIVVLSSAAPIRTSNGLISEAVMVFQDITAKKQLEQQKNEFFAVANHELRTPLTAILGFAELLQIRFPAGADTMQQYAITSIAGECEHLMRLIDELLDVSRLEHARLDLKKKYHDLLAPLSQMVTTHNQAMNTPRLYLTLEELEPVDCLMGWFDLLRIEQIFRNLLSNAMKYSPAGGEIEVGVRPCRDAQGRAQEVVIWVKDQGMGIDVRDLPHIFERFYRAPTFDESSISGFGIGLYLTRQLVQAHGGRIWAESTKGQGSTFFVVLPLGKTT
jgi:PAS domain S-box-containing protein